jgi:hypothetical protein
VEGSGRCLEIEDSEAAIQKIILQYCNIKRFDVSLTEIG